MAYVTLENVFKRCDKVAAVQDLNLEVRGLKIQAIKFAFYTVSEEVIG